MYRNSYLTLDVILKILELSGIGAAEKTSILSGNPMYAKNLSPHVVVDSNFLNFLKEHSFWEEYLTGNPLGQEAAAEIVSGIIRDHRGPIRKLVLFIPQLLDWAQHINKWLFSLPRNDIEEIILYNYNDETYKIGFLYLLVNLTRLDLRNCVFYQPFGGFGNLHCIRFDNVEFDSDTVGTVTYNFSNLVFFEAVNCSGFRGLKIKAPNLERFNVCATNGDGISMYEADQIRLKLDTKSVKGVDLLYDGGLGDLMELSFLCRPQTEESWRRTMISYRVFSSKRFYNPELEPYSRKWSGHFPSRKMVGLSRNIFWKSSLRPEFFQEAKKSLLTF